MNQSEKVKQFTEESLNKKLPDKPQLMTRDQVLFVTKMNCEELMELLSTVLKENENVKDLLLDIVSKSDPPLNYSFNKTNVELMAEQVDAFVDIAYYNLNAASKSGFNVDKVFNLVHEANMNKKFPDGTFHKNEEGKIIKPPNWVQPNVVEEVEKWIEHGTWTNDNITFNDALEENTNLTSTLSNLIHNFKNIINESDDYIESKDICAMRAAYEYKKQQYKNEYEKQQYKEEAEQLQKEDAELQKELNLLANFDFET